MTTISRADIQHLATLSSIKLTDNEIDSLGQDIEQIIGYVDKLAELDTDGVGPTYQVTDLQNVWREDEMVHSVAPETLIELAGSSQDGSVKVPKVL